MHICVKCNSVAQKNNNCYVCGNKLTKNTKKTINVTDIKYDFSRLELAKFLDNKNLLYIKYMVYGHGRYQNTYIDNTIVNDLVIPNQIDQLYPEKETNKEYKLSFDYINQPDIIYNHINYVKIIKCAEYVGEIELAFLIKQLGLDNYTCIDCIVNDSFISKIPVENLILQSRLGKLNNGEELKYYGSNYRSSGLNYKWYIENRDNDISTFYSDICKKIYDTFNINDIEV